MVTSFSSQIHKWQFYSCLWSPTGLVRLLVLPLTGLHDPEKVISPVCLSLIFGKMGITYEEIIKNFMENMYYRKNAWISKMFYAKINLSVNSIFYELPEMSICAIILFLLWRLDGAYLQHFKWCLAVRELKNLKCYRHHRLSSIMRLKCSWTTFYLSKYLKRFFPVTSGSSYVSFGTWKEGCILKRTKGGKNYWSLKHHFHIMSIKCWDTQSILY